ncbi:MAG TPA: signal peptidase II [Anaerolineae bacterium]|nr:signal peptidase II [Anaerolineae bacterium]
MLNSKVKDYLILFGVAGVSIGLDQWTKILVRANIAYGDQWLPEWLTWLSPYARFVHWSNSGAAFGMFQDGNQVFKVLAFIVIGAIIYYYPQVEKEGFLIKLAMGLQLGGATGNLIDRLLNNEVTDFISVGTFPVFNIADASISVGVVVLLIGVWIQERKEKANKKLENSEQLSVDSNQ